MTAEPRFLIPLARTLAVIVGSVLVLGALLGGAVAITKSFAAAIPDWAGLVAGAAGFLLLLLAGRLATHHEWRDSWRDCLTK
jgi:hypothetical protein